MDTGDTAWVLASCALVLFMTPGLAFFYGGMVRSKNLLAMLMQNFFAMGLVSVLWALFTFSLLLNAIHKATTAANIFWRNRNWTTGTNMEASSAGRVSRPTRAWHDRYAPLRSMDAARASVQLSAVETPL